jgi:Methyltransferase domain
VGAAVFPSEVACLRPLLDGLPRPRAEIGVGSGRFAAALGVEVGLDPAAAPLALGASRGVRVVQGVGERLPFRSGVFGAVLVIVTVCFADDPAGAWRGLRRVRPGPFLPAHGCRRPPVLLGGPLPDQAADAVAGARGRPAGPGGPVHAVPAPVRCSAAGRSPGRRGLGSGLRLLASRPPRPSLRTRAKRPWPSLPPAEDGTGSMAAWPGDTERADGGRPGQQAVRTG